MIRRFLLGFLLVPCVVVGLLFEAILRPHHGRALLLGVLAVMGALLTLNNIVSAGATLAAMFVLGLLSALHR